MDLLPIFVAILGLIDLGLSLDISTDDRTVIVNQGEEKVQLTCDLDGTPLDFINELIKWSKYQPLDEDDRGEEVILTTGGVLAGATDTQHYDVNLNSEIAPPMNFMFDIKDARPQESGLYVCKSANDEVVYDVRVIDPVEEVLIYFEQQEVGGTPIPSSFTKSWTDGWEHQTEINLKINQQRTIIACMARGGYPEPIMRISIGDTLKTGEFNDMETRMDLVGDNVGQMSYSVEKIMAVRGLDLSASSNGATISCTAVHQDKDNQDVGEMTVTAILRLQAPPQFANCDDTVTTPLNSKNFEIRCEYTSEPAAFNMEWKDPGQVMYRRGDDKRNGIITQVLAGAGTEGLSTAILKFDEVLERHLGLYILKVENDVGVNEVTIQLKVGERTDPSTQGCGVAQASVIVTLLSAVLALIYS